MGLVDDLVDLQAIERPDFVVAKEAVDLADVARRALRGLLSSPRFGSAGCGLDQAGLPRPTALAATGEFMRVLQVLVNLIGNAGAPASTPDGMDRRHASARPALRESSDRRRPGHRASRWRTRSASSSKFERVDPREPGGSGLGLFYIARRLARAMGGDVDCRQRAGAGRAFRVHIAVSG